MAESGVSEPTLVTRHCPCRRALAGARAQCAGSGGGSPGVHPLPQMGAGREEERDPLPLSSR